MSAIRNPLAAVLLLVFAGPAVAQPIFFGDPITADTTIDDSNPYPAGFGAYDAGAGSPTVELMEGGNVGGPAALFDESHLIMSGGSVGRAVVLRDDATFIMTGGVVGEEIPPFIDIPDISGEGSGAIHIRGGRLASGRIWLWGETSLHVYGTELQLNSDTNYIEGKLEDGEPVQLRVVVGPQASVAVHNIPEPRSVLVGAVLAVLLLFERRRVPRNCGGL